MPLRRLTKFSRIELEKEQEELERDHRGARRDPRPTTSCCGRSSPTSWPRWPRPTAPRAAPCSWSRPARPSPPPRCRSRSPTTRASPTSPPAACWPAPAATSSPARAAARTNHDVIVSAVRTTARGEIGVVTSRGRLLKLGVLDLPAAAVRRQRPEPPGRAAAERDAPPRRRRARARPLLAAHRRCRPRARHPPGRRQAGQPRGPRQGRVGRHLPQGRRRGRRRRRARHRRRDALLHHLRRPAAPLRGRRRAPAGPLRRRHRRRPGHRPASRRVWFGALDPARRPWSSPPPARPPRCPAPSPARSRSPRSASTHPRAAAPAASAATASSRARTPWSSPGPAPPRRGRRRPAEHRSTSPSATGRRDGSGVPASQPIAACAGPVAARLAAAAVCRLTAMSKPALLRIRSPSLRCPAAGRMQRRREVGLRRPVPRGGHGARRHDARRDQRGQLDLWTARACPREDRPQGRGRRRHPRSGLRRHDHGGPRRHRLQGPDRRGRRQGLGADPAHARLVRRRPRRVRSARPGHADEPRHRLLLAADRHRRTSRRARPSAEARTTRRSSPSTPGPSPATWSRTSSRARAASSTRRTP